MTKRVVQFFESAGEENTNEVIKTVVARAEEGILEPLLLLLSLVKPL